MSMNILAISGSTRSGSSNLRLLKALPEIIQNHTFLFQDVANVPTFFPDAYDQDLDDEVLLWKESVRACDALIICTPEYIHNIPAILKNALEWLAKFGELAGKPVLPITYTPQSPRGEKAIQSLLWSLKALDAKIVTSLSLHHTDIFVTDDEKLAGVDGLLLLTEAIKLLDQ